MGIKLFVATLFIVSIFSLFSEITQQTNNQKIEETPLVTFTDAIMYTLNHDSVLRIVEAKKVARYKTRDEMYNAMIITQVKENNDLKDIISAEKIVNKNEIYSFLKNVKYDRENTFSLKTNGLYYDFKKQISYNSVPFNLVYKGDILNGTNLYLDNKENFIKAKKSHFEININKENNIN